MNRPTPQDIFGKNATHESIMKMYADSHDLLRYAKALDDYIDWMEENSKMPTMEEMNDQFETLFPGLPKHCMKKLGFELCYDWLKNLAKPSKKP